MRAISASLRPFGFYNFVRHHDHIMTVRVGEERSKVEGTDRGGEEVTYEVLSGIIV